MCRTLKGFSAGVPVVLRPPDKNPNDKRRAQSPKDRPRSRQWGSVYAQPPSLSNNPPHHIEAIMITKPDILVLGLTAAVIGGLAGGILLFTGMNLIITGQNLGWALLLATGPVCAAIGWLLAKRLCRKA